MTDPATELAHAAAKKVAVRSLAETSWSETCLCDRCVMARALLSLVERQERMEKALEGMLDALAMEPLELAAKYGPDAHPDEAIVDAAHRARAALAEKG